MLICVAGKNNIAVDIAEYLFQKYSTQYEFGIVCNRCDQGINTWQKSLRLWGNKHGVKEYQLEELYDEKELIFLSMEYERIVRPELFQTQRLFNIHFSLLPKYKGMYTSAMPILNGETVSGVTFHCIDAGIDTGDIIAQREFKLDRKDTCRDLYLKYIENGTKLVLENVDLVISGEYISKAQPSENSTYYSKKTIDYSNLQIDYRQTAEQIGRQLRAFSFREYQMPVCDGTAIIAYRVLDTKSKVKPGSIIERDDKKILLSTIDYDMVLWADRYEELMDACKSGDLGKVNEICEIEEHINQKNIYGWTPLIVATYHNQKEIVRILLSKNADAFVVNHHGTNLLMYAKEAYLLHEDRELVDLYLEKGISPYEKDFEEKNLLDYLDDNNSIEYNLKQYLLEYCERK